MTVATEVMPVVHVKNPKNVIWDAMNEMVDVYGIGKIRQLDRVKATSGDCVICVYERPGNLAIKGHDGKPLVTPDNHSRASEDKFQGVVGMIVKTGPEFGKHKRALGLEEMPKVGDWVAFSTGDCISFVLGKRAMRLLQGDFIRMVLTDPDCII